MMTRKDARWLAATLLALPILALLAVVAWAIVAAST